MVGLPWLLVLQTLLALCWLPYSIRCWRLLSQPVEEGITLFFEDMNAVVVVLVLVGIGLAMTPRRPLLQRLLFAGYALLWGLVALFGYGMVIVALRNQQFSWVDVSLWVCTHLALWLIWRNRFLQA